MREHNGQPWMWVWSSLFTIVLIALSNQVFAQVTTNITSSGLNTQIGTPNTLPSGQVSQNITGGTRPGNGTNLFHSFGQFNVGEGHIANFLNDSGMATTNILGRVTGGNASNIFGTLQTTGFGSANLFLINPAGVLFGPNASLNVGGSFTATTANYMKLADGVRFNAAPGAQDALLSASPVAAFGFLGNNTAAIAIQGGTLRVEEGQNITLVGGNKGFIDATGSSVPGGVSITNGSLSAPGGQINIVSVGKPSNSVGEVPLNSNMAPTGFKNMGDIAMVRNVGDVAYIQSSGNDVGGKIVIRGGEIQVENYRIVADGASGEVSLLGKNVSITNNPDLPCFACGAREGVRVGSNYGSLTITGTDSVTLNGALIGSAIDPFATFGTGPITISAQSVMVSGTSFRLGGSRLSVFGENVTIANSGITKGENFSPVDVNIQAQKLVNLSNLDMQQLYATGDRLGSSVNIQGQDVQMTGVKINTSHIFMDGIGDAGPITVTGQRNVSISDSQFNASTGEVPRSGSPAVSDAGTITITAGKDLGVNNTQISANANWTGKGGNIILGAGTNVSLDHSTLSVNSTKVEADFFGTGPAGNIAIGAGKNVSVQDSALSANSHSIAQAGAIGIGAGKNLTIKQSSVSTEGLGGGADGHIVLGAGKNVSVESSVVTPSPLILEP